MMKYRFSALFLLTGLFALTISAQDEEKNLLVYFDNGRLDVFPDSMIAQQQTARQQLRLTTITDTTFCYDESQIDSVVTLTQQQLDQRLPHITQIKFNNKYNDQVFTDVIAEIQNDSLITAQIGAIGKWLTPSIQASHDSACFYVGKELQVNKSSRRSFANDVIYTVAMPRQRIFTNYLVKDAVYADPEESYTLTPIALDESMFSSNLPGKEGEGFAQMLDNNVETIYHSTWDVPSEEKEAIYSTEPNLDVALKEAVSLIRFDYTTRSSGNYWPLELTLYASNDSINWTSIRKFTSDADGLPTTAATAYESPVVKLGGDYRYLRFQLNKAGHRLYLVFAEFALWKAEENATDSIIEPAEYATGLRPLGRDYRVRIDWLTDNAIQVPRVDIVTETGEMISSKDYYLNATITIDGAGVFPSMEATPVQIKGRGNSSWSSWEWDKNPYRLKFEEKQKPFGLTKGKSWVLLANKQSGSMTSNAIGMKAACLAQTAGANHIVPVELYINGGYRGSYNFTEKVGFANNSIDLEDETYATLLELDTYYDETYRFYKVYTRGSSKIRIPVNIKEPDFSEGTTAITQEMIESDMDKFLTTLGGGKDIADVVDIDMLARYLLVNDLIVNFELHHPKSTFLYKEFVGSTNSKFVFGPVWDLDWSFGYERNRSYFTTDQQTYYWTGISMEATNFIRDLRTISKTLDKAYYALWTKFMNGPLDELIDFCDEYYAYASPSFVHNADMWSDGRNYARSTENAKTWLRKRADYIYSRLTSYDLDDETIDDQFPYDGVADGIEVLPDETDRTSLVDVYDLNGRLVKRRTNVFDLRTNLRPGIYIVNGRKMVIR
ncbi:MAG: CotH kinase family protein [Prevotella sp.]|nr:CotH kinase family protein [Prevotella sp.]